MSGYGGCGDACPMPYYPGGPVPCDAAGRCVRLPRPAVIRCRGCGKPITRAAGVLAPPDLPGPMPEMWADGHGFMVCVKLEVIHPQQPQLNSSNYVFHEPMPAGLDGGPPS